MNKSLEVAKNAGTKKAAEKVLGKLVHKAARASRSNWQRMGRRGNFRDISPPIRGLAKLGSALGDGIYCRDCIIGGGCRESGRTTAMKSYQEFEINYYQDEDGVFTAVVPAMRGCVASGRTLREAYRNAVEAIESCVEARQKVEALKLRKSRYGRLNVYRRPVHA